MTRRTWVPVFWLLLLLAVCVPRAARAEEEEPSAAELLRLATVAERVERDPAKAQALYERALRTEHAVLAARAGIGLADLLERQGQAAQALATLRAVEARIDELPPQIEKLLRERIARLEAPPQAREAPGSPLEIKIRAMFDRVEAASGDDAFSEMNFVRTGLESVGPSALPLLEKLVLERTPKTATLAAEMYARIGEAEAVAGLERMAVAADPLTRPLVVEAFTRLPENEEVSPLVVAAVDRLLSRPELSEHHGRLRDILVDNVTTESLLPRHRAGGPHALFWLEWALEYEEPGALERAVELVRAGGESGKTAYVALWQEIGHLGKLGLAGAWNALRAVTELEQDQRKSWAVTVLPRLVRLIEERGGAEAGVEARRLVWAMYATTESPDTRHFLLEKLMEQAFTPPPAFLADAATRKLLLQGIAGVSPQLGGKYVTVLAQMGSPFLDAFFAGLPDLHAGGARRLVQLVGDVYSAPAGQHGNLPPSAHDTAWLELLASPLFLEQGAQVYEHHIRAALRSADERVPEILGHYVEARGWREFQPWDALFRALLDWEHPERIAFLEAFLVDPDLSPTVGSRHYLELLALAPDAAARALLVRIARDPNRAQAAPALIVLAQVEALGDVLAIFGGLEEPWSALPDAYQFALIGAANRLRLREGIPFLLEEFRRGGRSAPLAAKAMDAIRAYHDRLAEFEAYADGRGEAQRAELARLQSLLADEDAEIRRAAVLALAAMGRVDALPRILGLAKDDPDERVRQAALDAVEKLAR